MLKRVGITRVLFVTLTFPPPGIRSVKAAQKKLGSFLNTIRKRYADSYIWVLEAHLSGGIHFHLLIPVSFDCHEGTDLDAWRDKFVPMENTCFHSERYGVIGPGSRDTYLYNSMNLTLRAEADRWQAAAKAHGFGRVQVAPIYSDAKVIRNYMTKQGLASPTLAFQGAQEHPVLAVQSEPSRGQHEVCLELAWRAEGPPADGGMGQVIRLRVHRRSACRLRSSLESPALLRVHFGQGARADALCLSSYALQRSRLSVSAEPGNVATSSGSSISPSLTVLTRVMRWPLDQLPLGASRHCNAGRTPP